MEHVPLLVHLAPVAGHRGKPVCAARARCGRHGRPCLRRVHHGRRALCHCLGAHRHHPVPGGRSRGRGVLCMSEVDIGVPLPSYFMAVLRAKEMGTVDVVFPSAPETATEALRLAARKWDGAVYSSIRISSGRVQDKPLLGVYLYLHLDHCPHCLLPEVHYLLLEDYNSGQGAPYLLLLADKAGEAGLGLELLSLAFYPGCWRRGQAGEVLAGPALGHRDPGNGQGPMAMEGPKIYIHIYPMVYISAGFFCKGLFSPCFCSWKCMTRPAPETTPRAGIVNSQHARGTATQARLNP